jgi:hypothetical protein
MLNEYIFLFEHNDFLMNTIEFRIDTLHEIYIIAFAATGVENRFRKIRTKMFWNIFKTLLNPKEQFSKKT